MIRIKSSIKIECCKCKSRYIVIPDLECVDSNYRNMGTETFFESVNELICSKCDTELVVTVEVWEYPENIINDVIYKCKNVKVIDELQIEIGEFYDGIELSDR